MSDAKRHFSRKGAACPAYAIGSRYLNGRAERQEYLETAIKWMNGGKIEDYMGRHQHAPNAVALWNYFQSVINWIEATFPHKRRFMKGVEWGPLYDLYKDAALDPEEIEKEIAELVFDEDVTKKAGIYSYVLTRDEKHLNIRSFSQAIKQKVYERQSCKCALCGGSFTLKDMEADHITPWVEGGKTNEENCQMLCRDCNRRKSSK